MSGATAWSGVIEIRSRSGEEAEWLLRALRPEAEREVPRARALLLRPHPEEVRIEITARDTGALRAALNTYLGWIDLAHATLAVTARPPESSPQPKSL
jgi:tRNA threonylcarbamoyladenosine modification (KEOPS) complex  Pcc1 subunit